MVVGVNAGLGGPRAGRGVGGARDTGLTFDEGVSFEGEHHLVDGGCGNLEVSLHVGLGRWASEHAGIGVDEGEVLPLDGGEVGLRGRSIFAKDLIHLKIHLGLGPPGGSDECTVSRRPQPIGT